MIYIIKFTLFSLCMNLQKFAIDIMNKLQQNAETAFFHDGMVLNAINDALDYIYTYSDRSRSVVRDEISSNVDTQDFVVSYDVYKPYFFFLDNKEYKRSNLPMYDIESDWITKYYVKWKVVKFWKPWKKLLSFYHRWAPRYDKLDSKITIDLPTDMLLWLKLCTMRILHPWGFEQWAQLSMTYFQMMKEFLDRKKKIHWFTIEPHTMKLHSSYNQSSY